jgi:glycosyltransferase involved in cell wall biosynthesis
MGVEMSESVKRMSSKPYPSTKHDFGSTPPLVSVVTPFFNTADYLAECIESVMNQTYTNWEYILADNCSTDDSGRIAEKYASPDPRIKFVRETQFVGQVENYNRALSYISPKSTYCKIVQADDWIYPECLREMTAVAESGDNVGLVSAFSLYDDYPAHGGLPLAQGPVYPGHEAGRAQLLGKTLFGSPTCVMYRSDVVRSRRPFFSATTHHYEDAETCFEILRDHDFGFVPQVLSFNRRDNDSIWTRLELFGPRLLHRVLFLYKFGEVFLSREELSREITEAEDWYYRFLARGAWRGHGKDFWNFHSQGLATIKKELSYRRVAGEMFLVLVNALLNPKRTIEARAERWIGRKA